MALGRKPIEIVNEGKHRLLVKADGWDRIFLGEIAKVQNGFAFSSKNFVKKGGMPLIRIRDIEEETTVDRYDGEYLEEFIVNKGDILVGMDGDFNAAIWKGGLALLNQRVCRIIPNSSKYDPKFLFICLQPYLNAINEETSAVTVKHLSSKTIEEIPLPYPKLPDQRTIVSKIEELFSELDKGIENLRLAQQQLKTYRQAVLKWAFEGRLTNENLNRNELPKGWTNKALGYVAETCLGKMLDKDKNRGDYYFYLRNISVRWGSFDLKSLERMQFEEHEEKRYGLKKDDLIICEGGEPGRCAIWKDDLPNIKIQKALHRVRVKDTLSVYFLYHFMVHAGKGGFLEKFFTGTTIKHLTGIELRKIQIPIPSLSEQLKIVQEIESRFSVSDKLEETIDQSLKQADALRQSILKMAFEGRLAISDKIEITRQVTKVIAPERKILAGKIIHLLHEDKYFGLTKFQKIFYLVENFAEVPYETNFIQERAGPYDKEFTTAFRREMQEKDWLHELQKGNITKFIPGDNIGSLIKEYANHFREKSRQISFILQHLRDKTTHDSELVATLYAVWNNRIIRNKTVKIELLVEDFFKWSAKKEEEFQKEEIVTMYKWMKEIELVPKGFGKTVESDV